MAEKYIIDHERYGQRDEFASLADAVQGLRDCGIGFEKTDLAVRAGVILDEDGIEIGKELV